jgi:NAD-dependent dihydropyrimidine dehydrogenase PreA subunit
MKRQIITIDEEKCTGCGECIPGCPEGALQIIDGKARLVSDLFCDGLGACIGTCPEGAISIEEREAEPYDEARVMENIIKAGDNTIRAHLKHLRDHNETGLLQEAIDLLQERGFDVSQYLDEETQVHVDPACGCPGSAPIDLRGEKSGQSEDDVPPQQSQLRNWPVQLRLINPQAQYFQNAHLLIAADCVPFSYADFHRTFLRDRILIMFCPKLDPTIDEYIAKLSEIFAQSDIQSITILRMEVPCCSGIERIVQTALQRSGKKIPLNELVISINGEILHGEMASAR